ncbi:TIGR02281 family clan AA aspartic protease [Gilvimarinus algae]|uniref:TIGR02281 family clan AA aspartic protease n=1 Tax=Gilvimarinus algae TaxID=3058037 RepID=A0ABT8TAN7_9GAMM|nr:TIGR02281 family clan AA aspartic protease [Gilvimarinus sp. SDUM040014]MDO3381184.1 TIGR02281 family clan AA aspartic protease [Gilvimarinus sp. SDUM040014]
MMRLIGIGLALWLLCSAGWAANLSVKMLAKDSALIEINGKQRMMRAGQTSPEGVTLLSASRAGAELEYEGQRYSLGLEKHIATAFEQADLPEVRIASGRGGHYEASGRINGIPVKFMVDTGATSVAMSSHAAEQLGINYRAGQEIQVSTANGIAAAYNIWLDSVSVGSVEVKHVEAAVIIGSSPRTILLGNSYLSLVDMSTEQGVLVLKARH